MRPSVPAIKTTPFDPKAATAVLRHCGTLAERAGDPLLAFLIGMAIAEVEAIHRHQTRSSA